LDLEHSKYVIAYKRCVKHFDRFERIFEHYCEFGVCPSLASTAVVGSGAWVQHLQSTKGSASGVDLDLDGQRSLLQGQSVPPEAQEEDASLLQHRVRQNVTALSTEAQESHGALSGRAVAAAEEEKEEEQQTVTEVEVDRGGRCKKPCQYCSDICLALGAKAYFLKCQHRCEKRWWAVEIVLEKFCKHGVC